MRRFAVAVAPVLPLILTAAVPGVAQASPELSMRVFGGSAALGGAPAQIRMRIENSGSSPSTGTLTVTGTLPDGLRYGSRDGSDWTCTAAGQTFTCTNTNPIGTGSGSGSRAQDLVVVATAVAVGRAEVSATLSGGGDTTTFNNTDSAAFSVGYQQNWKAEVSRATPGAVTVGTPAGFQVKVSKAGAGDLAGPLTLTGNIASALTPNAISGAGWTCQTGAAFSCTPSTLSWGTLDVNVTPTPLAFPTAGISVRVDVPGDQNPADDVAAGELTVVRAHDPYPVFSGGKRTVRPGKTTTFRVGVSNTGGARRSGPVAVTVTLPPMLALVSAAPVSAATKATCGPGQAFTCTFTGAQAGAAAGGDVKVTVQAARRAPVGPAEVTASLSDPEDENPSNNAATLPVTVACCAPKAKTKAITLASVKKRASASLAVGDKLVLRAGRIRWKVSSRPSALSSPKSSGGRRSRTLTFTANRAGSGNLRLTHRRGGRKITRTIKVTVAP